MATVAQLVRALVCGTRGRGFKTPRSPHFLLSKICVTFALRNIITLVRNMIAIARGQFVHKEIYHVRHLGFA